MVYMVCLSGTFLHSFIPLNDERLYMKDYKLIIADYPSNNRKVWLSIIKNFVLSVKLKIWMNA